MEISTAGKTSILVEDVSSGKRVTNPLLTILSPILFIVTSGILSAFSFQLIFKFYYNAREISNITSAASQLQETPIPTLINTTFTIIVIFLWVVLYEKRKITTLGFYPDNFLNKYAFGFLIGITMLSLSALIIILSGNVEVTPGTFKISNIFFFLVVILSWIIQGASEEILLRGFMMPILTKRFNIWVGILGNSLIFASLHLLNPGVSPLAIINLILFGIFASLYTLYNGNLWGICAIHSAWNFTQGNIFGFLVSGTHAPWDKIIFVNYETNNIINGGTFGPEGGLAVTLVLVISSILLLGMIKRKQKMVY